jgi:hypothetical protein
MRFHPRRLRKYCSVGWYVDRRPDPLLNGTQGSPNPDPNTLIEWNNLRTILKKPRLASETVRDRPDSDPRANGTHTRADNSQGPWTQ